MVKWSSNKEFTVLECRFSTLMVLNHVNIKSMKRLSGQQATSYLDTNLELRENYRPQKLSASIGDYKAKSYKAFQKNILYTL